MIEHEKPGNFPSSKRASKASSEPCTFPGSAGVRRAGVRHNALNDLASFILRTIVLRSDVSRSGPAIVTAQAAKEHAHELRVVKRFLVTKLQRLPCRVKSLDE